jgi:acetolactate synthase-1/2/3 large subunit
MWPAGTVDFAVERVPPEFQVSETAARVHRLGFIDLEDSMDTDFRPSTTAEHLLCLLVEHGVEHLFLNPGTDSAPLQEAMKTLPAAGVAIPKVHTSTFEAVSLAAAHAYYQATGRPQCIFVHVDAGTQNLGAMMHDAFRDRAGVIIIAGKTPYGEDASSRGGRSGYIQWLQDMPDQPGIVRGYTKWIAEITRPEMLDRAIGRAVQIATSYPAGPVYLTVSRDVLMDPPSLGASRTSGYANPSPAAIADEQLHEVAHLIASAKRPLLITSRAGRTAEGFAAVVDLVDLVGMTVIRGVDTGPVSVPTMHPLHRRSGANTSAAIRAADLIVIAECDVPYIPRAIQLSPEAIVVHIDPEPLKVTMPLWAFPVDIAITADGPTALRQLVGAVDTLRAASPEISDRFAARLEAANEPEPLASVPPGDGQSIQALDVVFALNTVMSPEDIVVEEGVTNSGLLYQNLIRSLPGSIAGAFAPGLGWALGGAIGAKLAHPDRRVVAVCGDGSFLFGVPSSALMMAAEMRTPFLVVVLNNDGYRASRLPVFELFPEGASALAHEAVGTDFHFAPDFATLAGACHAHGERVEKLADLIPALERALHVVEGGRAAVVDVRIQQ